MARISAGEATVNLLAKYGVDTVFGIPGVHTLEFYRGFSQSSTIRHIQARNELGAGFMADGYARSSGRPGVCLTISGPGVTNAATALGQAYADSLPVLLLSAEAATNTLGKGQGVLHEVSDLNAVTRPLCAFSECAKTVYDIPRLIKKAFEVFTSTRPRPVHIAIPIDILATMVEDNWQAMPAGKKPISDSKLIAEATRKIEAAKYPVLLVGGGAVDANITALAERAGAIVIASNAGKGIIADTHPLSLGGSICRPETQAILLDADLIIAIGTELSETDSYVQALDFSCPLIRIDIDKNKLDDAYQPALAIHGDAALSVEEILSNLSEKSDDNHGTKIERVASIKQQIACALQGSEVKHKILHDVLRKALSDDAFIMSDATQMTYSGSFLMPVDHARRWQYAAGYCALGFAFPNAIGAKFANPDMPVIAIAGDGGTMFTLQEWITAAEQNLPIPLILWHNDGYKQIRDDMRSTNVPRIAVDGMSPDFELLAKAMHCEFVQPTSLEAVGKSLKAALSADRPTIILIREDAEWLKPA